MDIDAFLNNMATQLTKDWPGDAVYADNMAWNRFFYGPKGHEDGDHGLLGRVANECGFSNTKATPDTVMANWRGIPQCWWSHVPHGSSVHSVLALAFDHENTHDAYLPSIEQLMPIRAALRVVLSFPHHGEEAKAKPFERGALDERLAALVDVHRHYGHISEQEPFLLILGHRKPWQGEQARLWRAYALHSDEPLTPIKEFSVA